MGTFYLKGDEHLGAMGICPPEHQAVENITHPSSGVSKFFVTFVSSSSQSAMGGGVEVPAAAKGTASVGMGKSSMQCVLRMYVEVITEVCRYKPPFLEEGAAVISQTSRYYRQVEHRGCSYTREFLLSQEEAKIVLGLDLSACIPNTPLQCTFNSKHERNKIALTMHGDEKPHGCTSPSASLDITKKGFSVSDFLAYSNAVAKEIKPSGDPVVIKIDVLSVNEMSRTHTRAKYYNAISSAIAIADIYMSYYEGSQFLHDKLTGLAAFVTGLQTLKRRLSLDGIGDVTFEESTNVRSGLDQLNHLLNGIDRALPTKSGERLNFQFKGATGSLKSIKYKTELKFKFNLFPTHHRRAFEAGDDSSDHLLIVDTPFAESNKLLHIQVQAEGAAGYLTVGGHRADGCDVLLEEVGGLPKEKMFALRLAEEDVGGQELLVGSHQSYYLFYNDRPVYFDAERKILVTSATEDGTPVEFYLSHDLSHNPALPKQRRARMFDLHLSAESPSARAGGGGGGGAGRALARATPGDTESKGYGGGGASASRGALAFAVSGGAVPTPGPPPPAVAADPAPGV